MSEEVKIPLIFREIDKDLLKKFKQYHLDNPHVYRKFKEYSSKMRASGVDRYSGWVIINVIRWEHDLATQGDVFKINNDFIALYVRLLIYHDRTFASFFEMRKMKESDRRSSGEERYRKKKEETADEKKQAAKKIHGAGDLL
jgi:hypothetical protein